MVFCEKEWKLILVVLVFVAITIHAIILLIFNGHLDSVQFLTNLLSGLIIVVSGWGLAWIIVHRYQRRNLEIQNKNRIIDEIAAFKISLRETTDAWLRCKQDEKNSELWYVSRTKLLDTSIKREILYVKILNQYPDYFDREFAFTDKSNREQTFKLENIVNSFKKYINKISDSLNNREYNSDKTINISEKEQEVSLYLSYVLLEIIREPLYESMKKNIAAKNE